jgi:hypothetical protein
MATYSADDIRRALEGLPKHGNKLRFLFEQFRKRGISFAVDDIWFERFRGGLYGIKVDGGGADLETGVRWALEGIRGWAGSTVCYVEGSQGKEASFTFRNAFPWASRPPSGAGR